MKWKVRNFYKDGTEIEDMSKVVVPTELQKQLAKIFSGKKKGRNKKGSIQRRQEVHQ